MTRQRRTRHPPTTSHNYIPKVLAHLRTVPRPDDFTEVDVLHDSWCDVYTQGFCNCDPVVRMVHRSGKAIP